ncbi:MAG TPA: HDOD domain-containing protein [Steroidobacteraceae bacterium]
MIRALLFLAVAAILVALIWSLLRRMPDRRERKVEKRVEAPRASLPSPQEAQAAGALTSEQVFERLHRLAFSVDAIEPVRAPEHVAVFEATTAVLNDAVNEPRYAIRRPGLLPQLLHAVHDNEVSRRELATMIAKDPALTGNLLKLANSPFYRINAQPVESVDRAVALLGTEGIRSLVATAIMQPVFRITATEFARFPEVVWDHTFRAGAASEVHAAIVEDSDPFAAQLLALIMGLSEIVVYRVAMDQYAARPELKPNPGVISKLLGQSAARVAHRTAASWDLSGRILAALEDQIPDVPMHEPTSLGRSLRFGRLVGALAALRAHDLVNDDVARASMIASGASGPTFERIWARLTGQPLNPDSRRRM